MSVAATFQSFELSININQRLCFLYFISRAMQKNFSPFLKVSAFVKNHSETEMVSAAGLAYEHNPSEYRT